MQLLVRGANGLSTHVLELQGTETVGFVLREACQRDGIVDEVVDVVMYCCGVPLSDNNAPVSDVFGNSELRTIDLQLRIVGGKVHGSLARAGKVKGQTPKVEKGEKKKKKTGRAKRRMQYNRRFVNVVTQFGRKKGPNSNTQ